MLAGKDPTKIEEQTCSLHEELEQFCRTHGVPFDKDDWWIEMPASRGNSGLFGGFKVMTRLPVTDPPKPSTDLRSKIGAKRAIVRLNRIQNVPDDLKEETKGRKTRRHVASPSQTADDRVPKRRLGSAAPAQASRDGVVPSSSYSTVPVTPLITPASAFQQQHTPMLRSLSNAFGSTSLGTPTSASRRITSVGSTCAEERSLPFARGLPDDLRPDNKGKQRAGGVTLSVQRVM